MSGTDLTRSDLGPTEFLAGGGTARVYRLARQLTDEPYAVVYKEYKPPTIRSAGPGLLAGLRSIVRVRDHLDPVQRRFLDDRTIWPLRIVVDNEGGAAIGIVMRLIPESFLQRLSLPSGASKSKPREVQFLLMGEEDAGRAGVALPSTHDRIAICAQIARSFGLLHRADVVLGDISARNVVYDITVGTGASVLLVDCDSVRVRGTRSSFGSQPHTPRWEPPEALEARNVLQRCHRQGQVAESVLMRLRTQANVQSKATDVYKFGLLVVRILDYGRGRSANRDPTVACGLLRQHVGRPAADLLQATLAEVPGDRPSMRDWYDVITGGRKPREPPTSQPELFSPTLPAPKPPEPPLSGRWTWVEGQGWHRAKG